MKKLLSIVIFILIFTIMSGIAFAIGYCVDIAPMNPPDKTFDDEWTGIVGEEIEIDVYLNDVPESIFTAGVFMLPYQYPGEEVTDIQIYDGLYGPPGPWDPGFSIPCWILCAGLPPYPVSFIVGNLDGAQPDEDGDIIICTIRLRFLQAGDYSIVFSTIPDFDTVIGFETSTVYDPQIASKAITIHQLIVDSDADGTPDHEDKCPLIPNGPDLGICIDGDTGASCTSNEDCGTDGYCSLDQNDYVCSCVGNFDCDYDEDGGDAAHFKMHFGRNQHNNPCANDSLCDGDFECDGDVDGTDAAQFKNGFGRSCFSSADYSASCMGACLSCVDGIYAYTCSYE